MRQLPETRTLHCSRRVALQRMQLVAGQVHVLGRLRRRQFRQDAADTASQGLRYQSGIVPFG